MSIWRNARSGSSVPQAAIAIDGVNACSKSSAPSSRAAAQRPSRHFSTIAKAASASLKPRRPRRSTASSRV